MARVQRTLSFAEQHPVLFTFLKLSGLGLVLWAAVLLATYRLSTRQGQIKVMAEAEQIYLSPVFKSHANCLNAENPRSCLSVPEHVEAVARPYTAALTAQWFLADMSGDATDAGNVSALCASIDLKRDETEGCRRRERAEPPGAATPEGKALAHRAVMGSLSEMFTGDTGCLLKTFYHAGDPLLCSANLSYKLHRDPSLQGRYGNTRLLENFHQNAIEIARGIVSQTSDAGHAAMSVTSLLSETFETSFISTMIRSTVLVFMILIGVWVSLYFIAFLRIHSNWRGSGALILFSLPPFAVALLAAKFVGFDPLHDDIRWKYILVALVGVIAGGITFDTGRRLLVLIDEELKSPVIRGLEHFGLRYATGRGLFQSVFMTLKHVKITLSDLVGVGAGLENERQLDHFVVRSAEYRLFEYLGIRASYVLDNMIILGLIFSAGGLISNVYKDMIATGDPPKALQSFTATIIVAIGLRFSIHVVHGRLFPGKGLRD